MDNTEFQIFLDIRHLLEGIAVKLNVDESYMPKSIFDNEEDNEDS